MQTSVLSGIFTTVKVKITQLSKGNMKFNCISCDKSDNLAVKNNSLFIEEINLLRKKQLEYPRINLLDEIAAVHIVLQ